MKAARAQLTGDKVAMVDMMLVEQVTEGGGDSEGSERLSLILLASICWPRASLRLSRGSGLRLAMRACAMELVSMVVWCEDL